MHEKVFYGPHGFQFEYRYRDDGTIDEILLIHKDQCLVHLEQLSEKHWYCGLYLPGEKPNENGVVPSSRCVQMWFDNLVASDDNGEIQIFDGSSPDQ